MQDTLMDHERRIAILEGIAQETRETLRNIESRLNSMDSRLDGQFNSLENRFNEVNSRITSILVVTIRMWATAILAIVGAALGFFFGAR